MRKEIVMKIFYLYLLLQYTNCIFGTIFNFTIFIFSKFCFFNIIYNDLGVIMINYRENGIDIVSYTIFILYYNIINFNLLIYLY